MITVRPSQERGHLNFGWLDTHHTFSFGSYYDPNHMGVSALRVLNDDRVAPGEGFPRHGHADMEILSYVLEGALEHRDSLGNGSVIEAGRFQRMSAGTGVTHSEFNARPDATTHFLQIWIVPERQGLKPSYEEQLASDLPRPIALVADRDGSDGAMTLHQDARVFLLRPTAGEQIARELDAGRSGYLHVIEGRLAVRDDNDEEPTLLNAGDGATVRGSGRIELTAQTDAHALLFDLP